MKKITYLLFTLLLMQGMQAYGQQLPDPHFEDWSDSFDGNAQPKDWHGSNVSQSALGMSFKFTFLYKKEGRTGSCAYVANQEVGAGGVYETAPGYFSLGKAWSAIEGLDTNTGTGGTEGGINFTYRPDTLSVWIKRTGSGATSEDFNIVFYSWQGESKGTSYRSKGGSCKSSNHTNEECDIRQSTNGNTCSTSTFAKQVAEGWHRERATYAGWTNIRVPIYYLRDDAPEKVNVIFSAGNAPNAFSNAGITKGNDLYVDDVELIYSCKIQKLFVDGMAWNGFNPDTEEEQVYSLGQNATSVPDMYAMRGAGSLTNSQNKTATFPGRRLSGDEITIKKGAVGEVTTLTVKSGDGKQTMTYKIRFVKQASTNAYLAGIKVDGKEKDGFSPYVTDVEVEVPYGTTAVPSIEPIGQENGQTYQVTNAKTLSDATTIKVTAADGNTTRTYTIRFKVGLLSDNTLKDIQVDGVSIPGFSSQQVSYTYSLPTGTTKVPEVKAVSAYADGEQTITYEAPAQMANNCQYKIKVSTKGNPVPKTYTITFKLEASSNTYLNNLTLDGKQITGFDKKTFVYYVELAMGATSIPKIGYEKGDAAQKVSVTESDVNGTSVITVEAANGSQSVYKIIFSTPQSENTLLKAIYLNGKLIDGFVSSTRVYTITLPVGSTDKDFPTITWDTMDEFQTVEMTKGGINGTTRIVVKAGNGATTQYQLIFSVAQDEVNYLNMIYVDGKELTGFDKETLNYTYVLSPSATSLPKITYERASSYQTVTDKKPSGLTGDYVLTVRPQKGSIRTYTITFTQTLSSNAQLKMIRVGGKDLADFKATTYTYTYELPAGTTTLPEVTYEKQEEGQKVLGVRQGNDYIMTVTAQDGQAKNTYKITFTIPKSESAFLKMIYLDGEPLAGFDQTVLAYTHTLTTPTCPVITVERADEAQQVTIVSPKAAGTAQIMVRPEAGEPNIYTIEFKAVSANNTQLKGINLDGKAMTEFKPDQYTYTIASDSETLPAVTAETAAGQTAQAVANGNKVVIYVQSGEETAEYELTFTYTVSNDCTLKSILLNGKAMAGFSPTVFSYTEKLAAGSTLPTVTYEKGNAHQTVHAGQTGQATVQLVVIAEDGTSTNTYTVAFDIPVNSDARLKNITLEGRSDFTYDENTYDYSLDQETGVELPKMSIETKPGQTTMMTTTSGTEQQVLVRAESGAEATYTVHYNLIRSNNVQLKTILIEGKELDGFDPAITDYTVTLPWRTRVIPSLQPIGMLPTQTVTTYRSSVNGTTVITVMAPDGKTSGDYRIHFPVVKSDSTYLADLAMPFNDDLSLEPAFSQEVTEYEVFLPYGSDTVPALRFTKALPEQSVHQIIRRVNETSEIIVTAENGDQLTYKVTFTVKDPTEENLLTLLRVVETNDTLLGKVNEVFDKTKRNFTANLPFGSRSMTVEYKKAYGSQTVFVESGGILDVTRVTAQSNVKGVDDEVYTITPKVDPRDPAVLTDIKVNGKTIDGFDPEQFSYIVNVKNVPVIDYTLNEGASINYTPSSKHWQATITYGTRVNTYHIWFYFEDDVIPNSELDIDGVATYNSAYKPEGWNTIADADDVYSASIFGSIKSGEECTKAADGSVYLKTRYSSLCARNIPAFITLAKVSGELNTTNSFSYSGSIVFRNSPDVLTVRYKAPTIKTNNHIIYQLWGGSGYYEIDETDTEAFSEYRERAIDLSPANAVVGNAMSMNIVLNSYYGTQGALGLEGMGTIAEMYVDWLRLSYNHTLTGLTVNGIPATLSGNAFSVTLKDPEAIEVPQLTFTGEVADQAQSVTWTAETTAGEYGVRTASIRNFAENGTDYTDYTLEVKRPLATVNTLADIILGGKTLAGFDSDQPDYTITLTPSDILPDLQAAATSSRAKLTTTRGKDAITIVVTPEYGETKTYTIHINWKQDSNVTLKSLTATYGTLTPAYDPSVRAYTLEADTMPDFYFVKGHTLQTVDVNKGTITVQSEDGNQDTYEVTLVPEAHTTSAQLSEMEWDGVPVKDFAKDVYDYYPAVAPIQVIYRQTDSRDSLVFIQEETGMTWNAYGSPIGTEHTYRIHYPIDKSKETRLKNILADGTPLDGFDPDITDYTIATDAAVMLSVEKSEDAQTVAITESKGVYTIEVTAEDGVSTATYTVTITPELSGESQLAQILADGKLIDGYRPDSLYYEITLPTPEVKKAEPQLPMLTYERKQEQQQVEIQTGKVGQSTYISVTAENGTNTTYELLIQAEPSHNAYLTGIIVNGLPVERFEKERLYYSTLSAVKDDVIGWATEDNFQKITTSKTDYADRTEHTIHVIAQDGVTANDYKVEIFQKPVSNDAELSNILLDGKELGAFEKELNPNLKFEAGNSIYSINLPAEATTLPQVSAQLKSEGQSVAISQTETQILITVTAKDGVSQRVYTLDFRRPLSSDATLDMIYIGTDEMEGFAANTFFYQVTLPEGVTLLPDVTPLGKTTQTVKTTQATDKTMQATILVTAQDGVTQSTYTVAFIFTTNDNTELDMLYLDGAPLTYTQGEKTLTFTPSVRSYTITLPVGTETFPVLTWDLGNKWQKAAKTVLTETATRKSEQVEVTAQSGRKGIYTVNYEILLSDNTLLESIIVNDLPLKDFLPEQTEYFYTVASSGTALPKVEYETADKYQTVRMDTLADQIKGMKSLGKKITITVTAQNLASRVYTIHFPVALSGESQLDMIFVESEPIEEFDKDVYYYTYTVPYNGTDQHKMPNVTVSKKLNTQNVTYTQKGDSIMVIHVMAEDGIHAEDYTIRFFYGKSPNAQLADIQLDGESMTEFNADILTYEIVLYDDAPMPAVEWIKADPAQQLNEQEDVAEIDGKQYVTLSCEVIAPDEDNRTTYSILFAFIKNAKDTLPVTVSMDSLFVRELPVNRANGFDHDFQADTLVYRKTPYALGTEAEEFFGVEDVRFVTADERVQAAIESDDRYNPQDGTLIERIIHITLYSTVPGDTANVQYDLVQQINLSHDSTVIMIMLDEEPMADFDPDVHYYQIPVNGRIPGVSVIAADSCAQTSVLPDGDTRIITCISQYAEIFDPGSKNTYTIEFVESPIDQSARIEPNDILVKYIPGSTQIAIACIRKDAQIAVYTADGHLIFYRSLQAIDPRYAIVTKDANGNDYFNDVTDLSQCTVITLDPHTLYFYTIYQSNKRNVTSGKLLFVQ